jgi:hypothetical protein
LIVVLKGRIDGLAHSKPRERLGEGGRLYKAPINERIHALNNSKTAYLVLWGIKGLVLDYKTGFACQC